MKKFLPLVGLVMLVSCSTINTPNSGMLFTGTTATTDAGQGPLAHTKKGIACTEGIIGVVTGDSSVTAAAADAKITKIAYVDHTAKNVLGIYTQYCTIVYGN